MPISSLKQAQNFLAQGNPLAAFQLALAVTQSHPNYATGWSMLGAAALRLKRLDEAVSGFSRALALLPTPTAADWHNLATAHDECGARGEAEGCYRKALAIDPDYADSLLQLAGLLRDEFRLAESALLLEAAVLRQPGHARLIYSLGNSLAQQGDHAGAMRCFDRALVLDPDYPDAHFYRGVELLAHGDLAAGWDEYEWRWKIPQAQGGFPPFSGAQWSGEPLEEKTLLVWGEQGLGDNLQFVRYLALLRERNPLAKLAYWCPQTLIPIFATFAQGLRIELVSREAMHPAQVGGHDLHVPLLSLPRLFGTRLASVPPPVRGLIGLDEAQHAAWGARVAQAEATVCQPVAGAAKPLRVGLVYSGNGDFLHASRRNLPLSALESWLTVSGVQWHSLQVGQSAREIVLSPWRACLLDWSHYLSDFSQTAALVAQLDLVITVDTAVAHLAGSMGKPVWLLNRSAGCWRWFHGREDSPWYPSMRIFTQQVPGDWAAVIARIGELLAAQVRATAKAPVVALYEKGLALRRRGEIAAALAAYDAALALDGSAAPVWMAKGFALRMQNDLAAAEACYRAAMRWQPDDPQTHYNLAIILLLQRRYAEGWAEYAWRWRLPDHVRPTMLGSLWQGESLAGQRIVVYQEQGFGDAIQFLRYVPALQALGATVTLAVRAPLLSLFAASCSAEVVDYDGFIKRGPDSAAVDFHASLLDIPGALGLDEYAESALALRADPRLVADWALRLAAQEKAEKPRRVGLVFSGNSNRLRNDHRSIDAALLAPLRNLPGVTFHLLQVDLTEAESAVLADWSNLKTHVAELTDFAQTAALLINLDLVLTVDTAVAHLAAALGKPTWVMVCHDSDWRWQLQRDDSPWYPTARLFRQSQPGNWDGVIKAVAEEIV